MWSAESGTAMDSGIEVSTAFNAANAPACAKISLVGDGDGLMLTDVIG